MILGLCLSLSLGLAGEVSAPQTGHASNPTWSPDGGWLAFELNNFSNTIELFLVKVQQGSPMGAPVKVNLPGASSSFGGSGSTVSSPTWHPQNMVVFEGSSAGNDSRLYFLSPGGAAPAQLLNKQQIDGDLSWPVISPDGSRIAFVSDASGSGDIFVWDRGSNVVSAAVQSPFSEMAPRYSRDGKRLAYTRKNQGNQDIFLLADGTSTPLVGGNGDQTRPAWAGDTVVFFSSERGEGHWDIVASSGAGQKKTIARDVRLPQRAAPAISPDGRWIAYGSTESAKANSIFFVSADGSTTREFKSSLVACGEPTLVTVGSSTFLAYTALPSQGADWRQLHIEDVTNLRR